MGLPVSKLILATNENNILTRFINDGDYSLGDVVPTVSPSMDIQLAPTLNAISSTSSMKTRHVVRDAFVELAQTGRSPSAAMNWPGTEEFLSRSVNQTETTGNQSPPSIRQRGTSLTPTQQLVCRDAAKNWCHTAPPRSVSPRPIRPSSAML